MIIALTKRDIAEMIAEQIDKAHLAQVMIGKIFYPYRDDTELMQILSEDYGNLDYVQKCVRVYQGTLLVD